MHAYVVIFNSMGDATHSVIRFTPPVYRIVCPSEDDALLPYADKFTYDFGEKDQQNAGVWRWYRPGNLLLVTVIRPDLLPKLSL